MSARDLFVLLEKFVKVYDIFIPGKRRIITKSRFGFVKVRGPEDAHFLIKKVNELWVSDQMMIVKEAFPVRLPLSKTRKFLPINHGSHQGNAGVSFSCRENVPHPSRQKKSYVDALKGAKVNVPNDHRDVEVTRSSSPHVHVEEARTQWLYCSLIGTLADDKAIKCSGMPHQLWSQDTLARIGRLWGEVIRGDHILNMMAMEFGWIKVRTDTLQPISQEVSLLNNGVLFRISATEESVFTPEQWVNGLSRLPTATATEGFQVQRRRASGMSSQRPHVSDSVLPAGSSFDGGNSYVAPCRLTMASGSIVGETCDGGVAEASDGIENFSNSLSRNPTSHRIVPFATTTSFSLDRCQLVVDLGRAFGPIPLLHDNFDTRGVLGSEPLALENVAQPNDVIGLLNQSDLQHTGQVQFLSGLSDTAQQKITKLGEQGRAGENSSTFPSSSSMRRGKGVLLKKKRCGITVKAVRDATMEGVQDASTRRDLTLYQEATAAWHLGQILGLQASGSDAGVIEKIYEMEIRDVHKGNAR
ncbi:hypothetical protein Dimus_028339 [Dionaea muscipula]